MAFWLWLIGVTIIGITIYTYKILNAVHKFLKYRNKVNKFPGPEGVYIAGNIWDFIFLPYEDVINKYEGILRSQQKVGHSVIRFWITCSPKIIILKGSAAEVILKNSKNLEKPYEYFFALNFLGQGLLISKKELWEKRRKMIDPSFHSGFLRDFMPIINEKADILTEIFSEQVEGKGPVNVETYPRNFALDTLCQSVLGVNLNTQRNCHSDVLTAYREIGDAIFKRVYRPWLWLGFIYNLTSVRKLTDKCARDIRAFSLKVVQERRAFLEKSGQSIGQDSGKNEVFGMKRRKATLDVLLESTCDGKKLTDEEVVDEVTIQIAAGHETTASSITFALFLLGHHPEIQKKAQEEVDLVLGEADRPVTYTDLAKFKYLDAVRKETHRIYPPIPYFGRVSDEDIAIDGHIIPAHTTIFISLMTIHHDADVFPEPEKFDPDRFLGSSTKGPSPYEFMPYGGGRRNCIGYKLADMELLVVLAKVLRKFDVISRDKPEALMLAAGPELRSIHGVHISLQRRISP